MIPRLTLLLLGLAAPVAAQQGMLAAPTTDGVSLRWVWPDQGQRPPGFHVERREPGGTWRRVTPRPLVRLRDRAAVQAMLGDAFPRYESLLFPTSPLDALADPEAQRSLLLLAADLEPAVARILALRFDDTAATSGATYEYRLIALGEGGEREIARSGAVTARAYREADPPDSLEADQPASGVALRWQTTGGFTAYHVFRRNSRGPWVRLNQSPVVVFSADEPTATRAPWFFRDTTATPGDTLGYAVRGVDPFGRVSRQSVEARLVVRDVAPPAPPPQVTAGVLGDTVRISWTRSPDAVVGYRVWRAAERDGSFEPIGAPSPSASTTATDLARPAGEWWYHVTAVDGAGNQSDPSFVAMALVRDLIPPAAPTGLAAVTDTGRITLRWHPGPETALRGFRVYRASTVTGSFGLLTARPVADTAYTDSIRWGADQPFYYRVTAVDSAFNESAPSVTLAASPPDHRAPLAPRVEWVRPCEDCVVVRWLPNPEADVTGYRVRFRMRGDSAWRDRPVVSRSRVQDTIPGLEARQLYDVVIEAEDDAGNISLPSRVATGEPIHRRPPPALAVRRVEWDPEARVVVVQWSAPGQAVERIRLERRDRETGLIVVVTHAAPEDGRAVDRNVVPGREYEYALRPTDRFGNAAAPAGWKRIRIPEERR